MIEWGYAVSLLVAAAISLLVARLAWLRRSTRAARPLAFIMLAMSWWSFTYALFWLRLPPQGFFWLDATYLGLLAVPITLLAFVLEYIDRGSIFTRRLLALLLIEPVLTLILIWTDPMHGLFFGGRVEGLGTILSGGPWFYLHVAYTYGFILYCFGLITLSTIRHSGIYRYQNAAVLVGGAIPLVVNVLALIGASPFPNLDLTPITFTATGLIFAFALFQLGFLDLIPIARDRLIEQMEDAVLVIDAQDNIADLNAAAGALLGLSPSKSIGQEAEALLAPWPDLHEHLVHPSPKLEMMQFSDDQGRIIDMRITPLLDNRKKISGRLVVLRDISHLARVENELRDANLALSQKIAEVERLQVDLQEQAVRDPLTKLFNRRYLEETLGREIAKSKRTGEPISVAMIDVDHFKQFNDEYGHSLGDAMLQHLAVILKANTREADFVCRYGGEEFAVVLPGATEELALQRMEMCRTVFQTRPLNVNGQDLHATLSAGVALFPRDAEKPLTLLEAADRALYLAKERGRNRVVSAKEFMVA